MKKIKKILLIIVLLIIFLIFLLIKDDILRAFYKNGYSEYVERYSKEYNVDENLVYAVIKCESNYKSNIISNKNAIGLMQVVEKTGEDIIKKEELLDISENISQIDVKEKLLEPKFNINIGTKYLSILLKYYNNKELAIAAYNAGIGTVNNWIEKGILKKDGSNIENIPYKETNTYVRKTLRDYKIYEKLYKY